MKMKHKADTGYLHDEPYQLLKDSDQIPAICLRFLAEYSWCTKTLNLNWTQHSSPASLLKAAMTLLNKHGDEGGELDKFILRKSEAKAAPAAFKLSDKVTELLHKRRKLLRDNSDNDFQPEAFHAEGTDDEE